MLVKGTIKGNLLTTEMGQFFVSRKGTEEMSGVFELSQIQASSIEKSVEVDGFSAVVKIPVLEAKIVGIYSQLYTKAKQPKYKEDIPLEKRTPLEGSIFLKVKEEDPSSNSSATQQDHKPRLSQTKASIIPTENGIQTIETSREILKVTGVPVCDEVEDDLSLEVKLFGKPLKDLGETYKVDASLPRDKQKEIISFLKAKEVSFTAANQEWLIGEACV
jgi:hypothetical protein